MPDVYTLDDFDFDLPPELIAQYPAPGRDLSRLLVLDRKTGNRVHSTFSNLPDFLREGDLMVFNDTRVINARIQCIKSTGGEIELLLTRRMDDYHWRAISNRMKRLKKGETVRTRQAPYLDITITGRIGDEFDIETSTVFTDEVLAKIGTMALPPYIRRSASDDDNERYQTIYAKSSGAVAAPTAGLHFTNDLFDRIKEHGISVIFITLNVSWGTFQPVRSKDLGSHVMHRESYVVDMHAAEAINAARSGKHRIIAVGTTTLRVLETTYRDGRNEYGTGDTDIFIYPPRKIESADCLITNFHTPRSTLLMLVSAFAGYDSIMDAYREAVARKYRFFSYGDAMFII